MDLHLSSDAFSPWADDEFFAAEVEGYGDGSLRDRVDAALAAPNPTNNQQRLVRLVEGMTPQQFDAATFDGMPLLVLAGAGTGKTKTLTARIALLVTAGMAAPSEILALTFTNKAAKEMATRIASMLDLDAVAVTATTFHAFCARMLRDYGGHVGWKTDWTILDSDDTRKMMRHCWKDRYGTAPDKDTLDGIEAAHDDIYVGGELTTDQIEAMEPLMKRAAEDYQYRKSVENVKDFSDLITEMNLLLEQSPVVLEQMRKRFKYVLVDEYQDTDSRQERLLRAIMGDNPNLTVVGDEDQLVYTWRHAKIDNIIGFETRWGAHSVRLEQNFRSTQNILDSANRLIEHNTTRLGKQLYTYEDLGTPIDFQEFDTAFTEADWIVEQIEADIAAGVPKEQIAVLVRASHALNPIESALNQRGIRYTLSGGKKFQDRQEIKDIAAYLRLIANAQDRMAFERAIAAPKRNVGPGIIEEIDLAAKKMRTDITDAARRMAIGGIMPIPARAPVLAFCDIVAELAADAVHGEPADVIVRKIIENTGYGPTLERELAEAEENEDKDAHEALTVRLNNLSDLMNIAMGKTISEFLDHLGLSEDTRKDQSAGVWIGTIHAAKGLEFYNVYLPAWEQGVLPGNQAILSGDLEEERRLGYVAITRARRQLTITRCGWRFNRETAPSAFLADLGMIERPNADAYVPTEDPDCPF